MLNNGPILVHLNNKGLSHNVIVLIAKKSLSMKKSIENYTIISDANYEIIFLLSCRISVVMKSSYGILIEIQFAQN